MIPARTTVSLNLAFLCAVSGSAFAQQVAAPAHGAHKAALTQTASAYEVHISPSNLAGSTSIDVGDDHWIARGYDLRSLIAEIYDVDARRIDLSGVNSTSGGDAQRYDVSLVLPQDLSEAATARLLQNALQSRFHVTIAPESRSAEVYVITAPDGPGPGLRPHKFATGTAPDQIAMEDLQRFTYEEQVCPGINKGGITASAGSIAEFRRTLEPNLDRLLVDESHLSGSYDFKIAEYSSREDLFRVMREQLGLVVTSATRNITVLAVRSAQVSNREYGAL